MRYVTIPSHRMFGDKPVALPDLLAQLVSNAPQWRDEWAEEWDEAQIAVAALSTATPGAVVGVTDEIHERFAHLLKSATIAPAMLSVVMPLVHSITRATPTKPEAVASP